MHVALLRGINVGKAKRVPMADLRTLCEELGYGDVSTLLNSGNLIFSAPHADSRAAARQRMFTARAASSATVVNDITACTIIINFAQRDSTGTSVGENAVQV